MGFVRSLAKPPKAQTGYAGAATNRLTLDWIMSHRSVDQEIRGALIDLRTRARELVRNTPWCRRYVRLLRQNVVGPHGIRLQARMQRAGTSMGVANDAVEEAWWEWGEGGEKAMRGGPFRGGAGRPPPAAIHAHDRPNSPHTPTVTASQPP